MPHPKIYRQGEKHHLIDAAGERWRVHDAHFARGIPHRVSLGSARANTRYFVNAAGDKRVFTLTKDASRSLDAEVLTQQLRNAGYIGKLPPFDGRSRDPERSKNY